MKNPLSLIKKAVKGVACFFDGWLRSKYIEIILAVALFILLDTGVLITNVYTSYQLANDAHAIQLASGMGTLSQKILHELYQVEEDVQKPNIDYLATIDVLADSFRVFDETLDAFIYGGELIGVGQGQDLLLYDTTYRDTSAHLLTDAEMIWKDYRVKLNPIVYAYFNDIERDEVLVATREAVSFARLHTDKLLELMQSFSVAVEDVATRKAERLRRIQVIGISLAVINFFLILFHFLRRLKNSDKQVEQAKKETDTILMNVSEGLFLMDRNFIIGTQHSESLHDLFKKEKLASQNFIDLLSGLVSEKDLEAVKEYTEILFSPRVNESLIADLNPLDQVEVNLAADGALFETRYFGFQFSRVEEKKELNSLLVTVKDITKQVQLADQLKAASEKSNKEIDMLLTIIHLDNGMLNEYHKTIGDGLNEVNVILKSPTKDNEYLEDKLDPIFRIVHKLKGDSSTLGLDFLVEKFHNFEQGVSILRKKRGLTGEDFLPLVVALKQLISDFFIIENLTEKMKGVDLSVIGLRENQETTDEQSIVNHPDIYWRKPLTTLVEKIATDHEKEVVLDLSEFDPSLLSVNQAETVKDIVVQSLRNAVSHSLETPGFRKINGKSPQGQLKVALSKHGNSLRLIIRDDGQSINIENIKEVVAERGLATEQQLAGMKRSKLIGYLFKPGFSTSTDTDVHSGQGVGLDLIKSKVDSLKGQIKLKYQTGDYTEFQYFFEPDAVTT